MSYIIGFDIAECKKLESRIPFQIGNSSPVCRTTLIDMESQFILAICFKRNTDWQLIMRPDRLFPFMKKKKVRLMKLSIYIHQWCFVRSRVTRAVSIFAVRLIAREEVLRLTIRLPYDCWIMQHSLIDIIKDNFNRL